MDNIENIWNYTARNVIIPDPSLHDGEIDISYHTFRILFKYQIIYYMMKINDIQLSKAYHKWKNSYKFNQHVYEIMLYILKKDKPRILINRNPTLNFYSLLLMKIRNVKKDDTDFTLSVPLAILPGLNADQHICQGQFYMVTYSNKLCEPLTRGVIDLKDQIANGRSYIRLGERSFNSLFKQHEYAS